MKKNVIAVLLSTLMAISIIGDIPVFAAEMTAEEESLKTEEADTPEELYENDQITNEYNYEEKDEVDFSQTIPDGNDEVASQTLDVSKENDEHVTEDYDNSNDLSNQSISGDEEIITSNGSKQTNSVSRSETSSIREEDAFFLGKEFRAGNNYESITFERINDNVIATWRNSSGYFSWPLYITWTEPEKKFGMILTKEGTSGYGIIQEQDIYGATFKGKLLDNGKWSVTITNSIGNNLAVNTFVLYDLNEPSENDSLELDETYSCAVGDSITITGVFYTYRPQVEASFWVSNSEAMVLSNSSVLSPAQTGENNTWHISTMIEAKASGRYTFKLTANGKTQSSTIIVNEKKELKGVYCFDRWDDESRDVYLDNWPYKLADNADLAPANLLDNMVGEYVYAEIYENRVQRLCALEEHIGAITAFDRDEDSSGFWSASQIQFGDKAYNTISIDVLNQNNSNQFPAGSKVIYLLLDGKIAALVSLEQCEGKLDSWNTVENTVTIDGYTYYMSPLSERPSEEKLSFWKEERVGFFKESENGNPYKITDIYEINLVNDAYYKVRSFVPEKGDLMADHSNNIFQITFKEPICFRKDGYVYLYKADDPMIPVSRIGIGESHITTSRIINQQTLEIIPASINLEPGEEYYILMDPECISFGEYEDDNKSFVANGAVYNGITKDYEWRFRTRSLDYMHFINPTEEIDDDLYDLLFLPFYADLIRKNDDGTHGTCYGWAYTVGAKLLGYPGINGFGDLWTLDENSRYGSTNRTLLEYIQLANLYQYKIRKKDIEEQLHKDKYENIYNAIQDHISGTGSRIIVCVSSEGGQLHALYPLEILSDTDSKTVIRVLNANKSNYSFYRDLTLIKNNGKITGFEAGQYRKDITYVTIDDNADSIFLGDVAPQDLANMVHSSIPIGINGLVELKGINGDDDYSRGKEYLYWYYNQQIDLSISAGDKIGFTNGNEDICVTAGDDADINLNLDGMIVSVECLSGNVSEYGISYGEATSADDINTITVTSTTSGSITSQKTSDGIVIQSSESEDLLIQTDDLSIKAPTYGDDVLITINDENVIEVLKDSDSDGSFDEHIEVEILGGDEKQISESMLSNIENKVYTGEEIWQDLIMTEGDKELVQDTDYTVSYENNINAGTAKVIITGIGLYSGTIEKEFEITPKNVIPAITLSADSFTYSGQSQKPMLVSVKDGGKALTDADFDITWPEECINSGTYEVDVTLKGNYSGNGKAVFTIKKVAQTVTAKPWLDELGVNLSTCCTVDGIGRITYTSSNPSVVTIDDYGWLTGCAEGTAIITVTANGDENHLSGQTTFEITVKSIYAVTSGPCGENATWTYYNNGTVEINGTGKIELRKNSSGDYLWDRFYTDDPVWDYKKVDTVIINEGITEIGGEFFSERSSYGYGVMSDSPTTVIIGDSVNTIYKWAFINCNKLERVSIGSGLTTLENCVFTYCPSLKDILVSESNNLFTTYDGALYSKDLKTLYKLPNDGRTEFSILQATVTIKEDALGDLEHLSKLTIPKSVKVIEDYALDGCNKLKDIYYEGSSAEWRALTIGTHNNVLETANIHYAENDKSVENCTLTLSNTSYVYDGKAKKPEVIIVDGTKTLEKGVDYQIAFANNTDAGTATITITGIGSYIGTVEQIFEITPKVIIPTVTLSQTLFTYNGKAQKPSVTVSYNVKQLKEGVDYNLAYDNNIEPGTASVIVTCIGNYSGSVTKEFTINKEKVLTGVWKKTTSGWWYDYGDGSYPKSKFENISGKTYYFNSSGYMVTGWQNIGGAWYYFSGSGAMATGWQKIGSKWYYMSGSGVMQTGLQEINGKTYYFSAGGSMATGWQKINNKWYYFSGSGAMLTGWQKISNKWYYFDANGAMMTGWQSIGGKWYYFEGSGVMAANKWVGNYYITASGAMATNTWIGKYYVGADGKWIPNYKAAN